MDFVWGLFNRSPPLPPTQLQPPTQLPKTLPTLPADVLREIIKRMDTAVPLRSVCWTFRRLIKPDRKATQDTIRIAAKLGYIALLEWVETQRKESLQKALLVAAYEGNLNSLKWLFESNNLPIYNPEICEEAARGGRLEVIKWVRTWNCPYGNAATVAARNGHREVLQWIVANGGSTTMETWLEACEAGQIDTFLWGQMRGMFTVDPSFCAAAAKGGRQRMLNLLTDELECAWGTNTTTNAAIYGHLNLLKHAIAHGCPKDLTPMLSYVVASNGHLEVLKYLQSLGCRLHQAICARAAASGNIQLLTWLRDQSLPWGRTTSSAAEAGHVHILQWARERACPWDADTLYEAGRNGHVAAMEWAFKNGAPWDDRLEQLTDPKVVAWIKANKTSCTIS